MNNQKSYTDHSLITGNLAIKLAVEEALDGKTVSLELAHKDSSTGLWESKSFLNFGMGNVEGTPCLRYCGKEGKPNGEGSSSVIATWYKDCLSKESLIERITLNCHGWTPFKREI